MNAGRHRRLEEGETLLEVLIALAIMGIATASILGLFQSSIFASTVHKQQSVGGSILDNFAEYMQDPTTAPFSPCPTAKSDYATDMANFVIAMKTSSSAVYQPDFARYVLSLTVSQGVYQSAGSDPSVVYPDPATDPACTTAAGGNDRKVVQRLTLSVSSTDSKVAESVQLVRRHA